MQLLKRGSLLLLVVAWTQVAGAADVVVTSSQAAREALAAAQPGDRVLLAPGTYDDLWIADLAGAPGQPITLAGQDPADPPRFLGGRIAIGLSQANHVTLRDLLVEGPSQYGISIDDGGTYDTPATGILIERVTIRRVGREGNRDGIKLAGVDDFAIRDCTLEGWGSGGDAIDMVGCHQGLIEYCTLSDPNGAGGIQAKGGTSDVSILQNRFIDAGARAINIGGSTGLEFFRPQPPPGYEATDITVVGNLFVGGETPVAFVGVDGAAVINNTIVNPSRWVLRILQETTAPGFVPSRNGVFAGNIVVYRTDRWVSGGVNIGPNTAPETFVFRGNVWYALDDPGHPGPELPTPETDGRVGVDPRFRNLAEGDYRLAADSDVIGTGHTAGGEGEPGDRRNTPTHEGPVMPPADAIVLFGGTDTGRLRAGDGGPCPWQVVDGALEVTPGTGNVFTRDEYGDCQLHVEFWLPNLPEATGQAKANSGVYLQARYEVQVLDSFGIDPPGLGDCGAIYSVAPPLVNAARPPETWQTYDIFFRAPRHDEAGELVEPPVMSVFWNGICVHHNVTVPNPTTAAAFGDMPALGPLMFQDHGQRVRYRNLWLRPLPRPDGVAP